MTKMKIAKVKGRPLLHWVGKKPIDAVESYPARLVETVGGGSVPAVPTYEALREVWSNLLFHGDNKEVLSTLLVNGFRGKVDLIYIDPPFDSGADYVRKVELRGTNQKVAGEEQTALEQIQYEDIWANDNYLQFMYERLILLRELLSEQGSIYLHCDWHKSHHLRILLDEVFGAENFVNEIIREKSNPKNYTKNGFGNVHDTIFFYAKSKDANYWNKQYIERMEHAVEEDFPQIEKETGRRYKTRPLHAPGIRHGATGGVWHDMLPPAGKHWQYVPETLDAFDARGQIEWSSTGNPRLKVYADESEGIFMQDMWTSMKDSPSTGYPTEKNEAVLETIIQASTEENSIVLDCFVGSGTTVAVAQRLGRRWIGADLNKGAIQTTMKRLQKTVAGQASSGILHYQVNNYDFQEINALREIIVEKYGIMPLKTDVYFDGTIGPKLVKIAELNKPITVLDLQGVIDELKQRGDEARDILLVGSGVELGVEAMLAEHNKLRPVNRITLQDIQSDGMIAYDPAEADVTITKADGSVKVVINTYLSPTIIKRLDLDRSIFGEHIKDFRTQIDVVLIDTDYNGTTFNVTYADVPPKKQTMVAGVYELSLPRRDARVAVKIVDMLGEETLVVE
jgi:adenine-specific DNA-methyltransferase